MNFFFFFNDTATTEIYTLSLHDALPIYARVVRGPRRPRPLSSSPGKSADLRWISHGRVHRDPGLPHRRRADRKSTRLNSSHSQISYAVFCLKKKKKHRYAAWAQHDSRHV